MRRKHWVARNTIILGSAALVLTSLLPLRVRAVETATVKGTVSVQPPDAARLQDIVVYIEGPSTGGPATTPHPTQHATMDQKDLTFIPHVLPVMVGTTVDFLNSDDVYHNAFSNSVAHKFDLGMFGHGETRSTVFDKPGIVDLHCNVHPKMHAYILVLENPHFAVPSADGSYTIGGVAPGRYKVRAWHERLKPVEKWVNLGSGEVLNVNLQLEK